MNPQHEKLLKKTKDGKTLEKKQIGKGDKEKKELVEVAEKFNQPCIFGEKCKRKKCLFVHDKPTLGDKKAAAEKRVTANGKPCKIGEKCTEINCKFAHPPVAKPVKGKTPKAPAKSEGNEKPCRFGALCTKKDICKFSHPSINKPCKWGTKCSQKGCKFDHSPASKALERAKTALKERRRSIGARIGDLRSLISPRRSMARPMGRRMGGGMGTMGGMGHMPMGGRMRSVNMVMDDDWDDMGGRNTNLAQMQSMKQELEDMMAKVMGQSDEMRGGYGGSSMGETSWYDGRIWRR